MSVVQASGLELYFTPWPIGVFHGEVAANGQLAGLRVAGRCGHPGGAASAVWGAAVAAPTVGRPTAASRAAAGIRMAQRCQRGSSESGDCAMAPAWQKA